MKNLTELVNENKEEIIEEAGQSIAVIGIELALLATTIGVFVKSFKDIANGENGIIEIINKLKENVRINKICKKLSKDKEVRDFLATDDKNKKDEWENIIKSKLNKKEANDLLNITKEMVGEYIK